MIENRIYNFAAGPSILPESVLLRAQKELLNTNGSGMSVLEMSHRSPVFEEILHGAEQGVRDVLGVPDNYKVLFLQGGASGMFAAVPMNLGTKSGKADYIVSGNFANGAYKEAKKYLKANCAASSEEAGYTYIPKQEELALDPEADYVHVCWNNTIFGTKYNYIPDTGNVPLVADMSSSIMSEPVEVAKYGMIYAGVQKNLAPAGLVLAVVREDLIGEPMEITPKIWGFAQQVKSESMINTPPCWQIYMTGLVTEWIRDEVGGLAAMKERNAKKAALLYDYLDSQNFYLSKVNKEDRSMMNVVFRTVSADLDAAFVKGAAEQGMVNLKGHRLAGGMRASIYNAMPYEGAEALVAYMEKFAKENR